MSICLGFLPEHELEAVLFVMHNNHPSTTAIFFVASTVCCLSAVPCLQVSTEDE